MSLEQLAYLSTIVQAVLVVISLLFIYFQLRQNTELARAANAQSLVEHAGSFNSMLIQNKDLATLWYSHGKDFKNPIDEQRYRELIVQWLIFHENIYYQHKKKLLDDVIYNSWRTDLKYTVQHHNLSALGQDWDTFFPGEFGHHLAQLRKET
jgi:hypothetical protein